MLGKHNFDQDFDTVISTIKWGMFGSVMVSLLLGGGIGAIVYAIHTFGH